ncbi:MAG: hypothetical protein R2856_08770 [Caldilineaceae bacterium]
MTDVQAEPADDQQEARSTAADDTDSAAQTDTPPTPTPEPTPVGPLAIAIDERVPVEFQAIIEQLAISGTIPITIPSTTSADVGAATCVSKQAQAAPSQSTARCSPLPVASTRWIPPSAPMQSIRSGKVHPSRTAPTPTSP